MNKFYITLLILVLTLPITALAVTEVNVTSPNGGETIIVYQTSTIEWTAVSDNNVLYSIVSYSDDHGDTWTIIDTTYGDDFDLDWNPPEIYSIWGLVKVTVYDDNQEIAEDISDDAFSIAPRYAQHLFVPGWTMISLPLNPDDPDIDEIIKDDIVDLRGFYGFEMEGGFYRPEELQLGKGYWLAVEHEEVHVDMTGDAQLDTFRFDLDLTWNMIGAPFPASLSLADATFRWADTTYTLDQAVDARLLIPVIHICDPTDGYDEAVWFAPWHGGWFLVLVPDLEMLLYPTEPEMLPPLPSGGEPDGTPGFWKVPIVARAGDAVDRAYVGAHTDATNGYDIGFDFPEPPVAPYDGVVSVYFNRDEWPRVVDNHFNSDVREMLDNEQASWDLIVNYSQDGEVTLNWPGIADELPYGYQLVIYDEQNDVIVNMLETDEYTFNAQAGISRFRVTVTATPLEVENELVTTPDEFRLLDAFPNPFNSSTVITYNVPQQSMVSVDVFNMAGQRVDTIVRSEHTSGQYNISWQADELPAGVYLIRMQAGTSSAVRKLVLVK